ncbi:transposase [Acidiferrobacter sp. SPIII_3]|uniref:RNA-guided endonuclease InsQ/TnpB family protein n=1 Tax=Acidiferrobacter sp. SPIII_3 TaxID=1281578 RepID=UPI00143D2A17|nr:transposase [Acidiferrobacter sp. SPIII_3]
MARLHAQVARQRQDFLHQTSAGLVKRFGAIGTETLAVKNMVHGGGAHKKGLNREIHVHGGGAHKKGLNREIHAASPAAFLKMTRTKAEQAGSWYEEAPTREIKPTQRCHGPCGPQCGPCGPHCACGQLPDEKKTLSDRQHQCPHCGATCGRDDNAALVLLRWLETRLAGIAGRTAGNEHETHAMAV